MAQPASPTEPGVGRRAGSRSRLRRIAGLGLLAIIVGLTFLLFCVGATQILAYHLGAPTTATIEQCHYGTRSSVHCTGTWSVGGKSYAGPIRTGWQRLYSKRAKLGKRSADVSLGPASRHGHPDRPEALARSLAQTNPPIVGPPTPSAAVTGNHTSPRRPG